MCMIDSSEAQKLWWSKYKALVEAKMYYPRLLFFHANEQNDGSLYCRLTRGTSELMDSGQMVARFNLHPFPYADIGISVGAEVLKSYQGQGIGKLLNQFRLELMGDKPLMCTVNDTNAAQHKVLLTNGWKRLGGVGPSNSLWMKGLRP